MPTQLLERRLPDRRKVPREEAKAPAIRPRPDRATWKDRPRFAESEIDEVQEYGGALRRMREGTFGLCDDCGCAISMMRLKINRYARLCLECRKAEEAL